MEYFFNILNTAHSKEDQSVMSLGTNHFPAPSLKAWRTTALTSSKGTHTVKDIFMQLSEQTLKVDQNGDNCNQRHFCSKRNTPTPTVCILVPWLSQCACTVLNAIRKWKLLAAWLTVW